jgi:hypothetical protein
MINVLEQNASDFNSPRKPEITNISQDINNPVMIKLEDETQKDKKNIFGLKHL